tara:strand:+ start:1453 stop:2040 length:588 start_codon:yes stop_codon:yes gene_type:complete
MKNIEDYVYRTKISDSLLKETLIAVAKKENKWLTHSYTSGQDLKITTTDKEFEVSSIELIDVDLADDLMGELNLLLSKYVENINSLMKLDEGSSLTWGGFTSPRINRYNKKTIMKEHFDHINSIFDGQRKGIPTLTILGLLQNADKGGEFVMWGDKVIDMKPGEILIFPSLFMYRHKVNEILEGTRISFVSWVWG